MPASSSASAALQSMSVSPREEVVHTSGALVLVAAALGTLPIA